MSNWIEAGGINFIFCTFQIIIIWSATLFLVLDHSMPPNLYCHCGGKIGWNNEWKGPKWAEMCAKLTPHNSPITHPLWNSCPTRGYGPFHSFNSKIVSSFLLPVINLANGHTVFQWGCRKCPLSCRRRGPPHIIQYIVPFPSGTQIRHIPSFPHSFLRPHFLGYSINSCISLPRGKFDGLKFGGRVNFNENC